MHLGRGTAEVQRSESCTRFVKGKGVEEQAGIYSENEGDRVRCLIKAKVGRGNTTGFATGSIKSKEFPKN